MRSSSRALGASMAASITAKIGARTRVIGPKAARAISFRPGIDCSLLPRPNIWNPRVPRNGGLNGTWCGHADAWSARTNMGRTHLDRRHLGLGGRDGAPITAAEESAANVCMGNLLVLLAVCEHVDSPPRANSWSGLPDMGHVAFQELPRAITQFAAFAVGAQARWLMSSDTSRDVLSNVEHGAFAGLSLSCFAIGATELAKVVQPDIDRAVMAWRLASFCRETPSFVLGRVISPIKLGRTDV
jgi:hypothetical protein